MAVWEFILVAKRFDLEAARTATFLQHPIETAQAALNYYSAFGEEIDHALEDNHIGEERLKRLFPSLRVFSTPSIEEGEPS